MSKNELILWFGDSHVETISIRCFFICRLLSYCEVDFEVKWVKLPEEAKKLDVEAKLIPILNMGGKKLTYPEIIEFCRVRINKLDKELLFPDYSLVQTITFQWATTTLLGLYVNYVYTCDQTRQRFFKDFKASHSEINDKSLHQISQLMSQWVDHCASINIPKEEYDNHVFQLLEHFDNQLKDHDFFFGNVISATDIAIFSFVFLICNPHIHKFKEKVRQSKNLFQWSKRMDHLTQHEYRKYRI